MDLWPTLASREGLSELAAAALALSVRYLDAVSEEAFLELEALLLPSATPCIGDAVDALQPCVSPRQRHVEALRRRSEEYPHRLPQGWQAATGYRIAAAAAHSTGTAADRAPDLTVYLRPSPALAPWFRHRLGWSDAGALGLRRSLGRLFVLP